MGINTNVHLVFIYVSSKKCIQLFLITDFCLQTARKTQPFVSNTIFAIRPYAYFFSPKCTGVVVCFGQYVFFYLRSPKHLRGKQPYKLLAMRVK